MVGCNDQYTSVMFVPVKASRVMRMLASAREHIFSQKGNSLSPSHTSSSHVTPLRIRAAVDGSGGSGGSNRGKATLLSPPSRDEPDGSKPPATVAPIQQISAVSGAKMGSVVVTPVSSSQTSLTGPSSIAGTASSAYLTATVGHRDEHADNVGSGAHARPESISNHPTDQEFTARLRAFYLKNNPSKIENIPSILKDYAGREDQLVHKLEKQYKTKF